MFKILGNNKLRVLNFGYDGCRCDYHVYKFSRESMGFVKSYNLTHLILLQMSQNFFLWIKGVEVNIPTKFERNLKRLKFCDI